MFVGVGAAWGGKKCGWRKDCVIRTETGRVLQGAKSEFDFWQQAIGEVFKFNIDFAEIVGT
jgi:hypothetical protein